MQKTFPVMIIGAGAAGISCAQILSEKGMEYAWVEARPKIGGRVRSEISMQLGIPVELGAEFIHGTPKNIFHWLSELHLPWYDIQESHYILRGKKLRKHKDYWGKLEKLMKRLNPKRKQDRTAEEFLRAQKALDSESKAIFKSFVEGFHAADLSRLGEIGLSHAEESSDEELQGSRMFKPLGRYDALLDGIMETFNGVEKLELNTVVKKIKWQEGEVEVTCQQGDETKIYHAEKLVITLPIGVLQSGEIEWEPRPKMFDRLFAGICSGHVQKVQYVFRERFWEKLSDEPIYFVHPRPTDPFVAWWTTYPIRANSLTAWQGGPRAKEMSDWPKEERVEAGLKTLSKWSKRSVSSLRDELISAHTHDWSQDRYSLGAYSYIAVNGMKAAREFTKPVGDTLYFAGEATQTDGTRGTVHGALKSGERVAKMILKDNERSTASK